MPIKGIDHQRCNLCQECINECIMRNFKKSREEQQIIFDNSKDCILCGHCIAVCPEDAIIYEDMKDNALELEELSETISYEALYELIRARRSIRQYKNKKVPKEIIEKILECVRYAATALNRRTLKCLIVSNNQKINEFIDTIIDAIEEEENRESYKKKRENGIDPFFHNAPHLLIFHSDSSWDATNATIAITNAMLCAQTLDLGSCWIGGVQRFLMKNKEIQKKVFGIDDKIFGIMVLGYPAVKYYRAPPRPPLEINEVD